MKNKQLFQARKRIVLYTFFAALIILNSCSLNPELISESNDLTVESAKLWFENTYSKSARISNDDIRKEYNWDLASKQKVNKTDEAVIIPIIHQKKGDLWTFKHLWIYNDKNKEKKVRIFEYIYDTKLPKNRLQSLKNFTGAMIMRDGEGVFLGGLKVANNVIEGLISEYNANGRTEKIISKKNKNSRVSDTICAAWENCRNWNISYLNVSVNGSTCLTEFGCWWISNTGIDPAFTGILLVIPTIPATAYFSATGNGDWPTGPPTATNFGYAPSLCEGYNTMLSAQTSQSKEILAAITSEGKVIMFPTQSNDAHNVNFSFPYSTPDGLIMMNYVVGNPDPANPLNDGKYQDDDIGIEIADRVKGVILYYKVVGFVHSHPIENGYDYDNPSPNDKTNASQYPSKIKHYILNDNKLIEFNSSGIVSTINRPCK